MAYDKEKLEKMIDRINNIEKTRINKKYGITTCNDCKNHFYSDCYLECSKHERINNDKICFDFERVKE